MTTLGRLLVLGGLLAVAWGWPHLSAQGNDHERRIDRLEGTQAERRIAVLESRLDSIETVGKGILIAVAAQLLLSGLQLRPSNRGRGR